MADLQQSLCARLKEQASTSTSEPMSEARPCARVTKGEGEACPTGTWCSEAKHRHPQGCRSRRSSQLDSTLLSGVVTCLPAAELFNTLRVEAKIGEGRFGTVWRCQHPSTGAQFACKQVDKRSNPKALLREIECLTRAQGSPHVLALEGVYESELYIYIVTELCNGGDLFEYLSRRGPLPEQDARAIFCQLAQGLRHCHAQGVMHRDIKPENVLLSVCPVSGKVTAKLADFGLSKKLAKGEMTVGWVGSDPYEAPEVVALRPYNFSADVFSLGVLLFGMLSGTWPTFLEGRRFDEVSEFAWTGWRRMSREAKDLISSMLSQDPARRPNMGQVTRDAWLCGHIEEDFMSVVEKLMQARREAQMSLKKERVQCGARAEEAVGCSASLPAPATPKDSNGRIAPKEDDCSSEGSGFSWAGSELSTPRSMSEDVQCEQMAAIS